MDTSRIDDHKRSIEDLRDQRARIDYAIELHMADLYALEAKRASRREGGRRSRRSSPPGKGGPILQKVKCGKDHCRCSKLMHGPYWYLFTKSGGKTKSKYIGQGQAGWGVSRACLIETERRGRENPAL